MRAANTIPKPRNTRSTVHIAQNGVTSPLLAKFSPPMRPAQYTAKMTTEVTMTMPTPPRGKRMASGAPSKTNTIHANAIEYFL